MSFFDDKGGVPESVAVSFGLVPGYSNVDKFGRNPSVGSTDPVEGGRRGQQASSHPLHAAP